MQDAHKRMRRRAASVAPVLRELRGILRTDLEIYARHEESPDGRWPARASTTTDRYRHRSSIRKTPALKKRIRRQRKRLLGMLPKVIHLRVGGNHLLAISKVPWSGVHQEGGVVGRGSVLPARPHVFISDTFFDYATERCLEYVMKGWG